MRLQQQYLAYRISLFFLFLIKKVLAHINCTEKIGSTVTCSYAHILLSGRIPPPLPYFLLVALLPSLSSSLIDPLSCFTCF